MGEKTAGPAKRPREEDGDGNHSASKAKRSAAASPRGVEVPDVVETPPKTPTDDGTAAAAAAGVYKFPSYVRDVLAERIAKLRSGDFPETDSNYTIALAWRLEGMLKKDDSDDPFVHRLAADLAIVASRVAHAQDRLDNNDWVFQHGLRQAAWLEEQCSFRAALLGPGSVTKFVAAVQSSDPRALTREEKERFVEWHRKAREPRPPLLDGSNMAEFLDAQTVHFLAGGTGNLRLRGLSSFDGTQVYVVDGDFGSTVPHELEHNLRRYTEADPHEKARLVSSSKDSALRIENSQGESLQCGAGFVMEKKNGRIVPDDLIDPFSARWNRRFLK